MTRGSREGTGSPAQQFLGHLQGPHAQELGMARAAGAVAVHAADRHRLGHGIPDHGRIVRVGLARRRGQRRAWEIGALPGGDVPEHAAHDVGGPAFRAGAVVQVVEDAGRDEAALLATSWLISAMRARSAVTGATGAAVVAVAGMSGPSEGSGTRCAGTPSRMPAQDLVWLCVGALARVIAQAGTR
jgi:hypothetical protein